ncbi:MAG TPA: hypothetical protein EYP52_04490 [Anaerolineae bacterium]|nr:hypothetical protein [Anaerolineae bacterium]
MEELEEAYRLDPEAAGEPLARALVALAAEREGQEDREGALSAYRRVLEVTPAGNAVRDEVEAILAEWDAQREKEQLLAQATELEREQRWDQAAAVYRELAALTGDADEHAQWQEALARCETEAELAALFEQAVAACERKEWATAENLLEEVIERRPDYERNGRAATALLLRVRRRLNPPGWVLLLRRISPLFRRLAVQSARVFLRLAVVLFVIGVLLFATISFAGAYAISFVAERVIAATDWGLDASSPGEYTVSEETLNESVASALEMYALDMVSDVRFDLQSPDVVLLSFRLSSTPISLRARLQARDGTPWVMLEQINDLRPYILGGIVSNGFNEGFRRAWEDSPLRVTSLQVEEQEIDVTLR